MGRRSLIAVEDRAMIINAYTSGKHLRAVADMYGCSHETIRVFLEEMDVLRKIGAYIDSPFPPVEIQDGIADEFMNGVPIRAIAEAFGITEKRVSAVVKLRNLPLRKPFLKPMQLTCVICNAPITRRVWAKKRTKHGMHVCSPKCRGTLNSKLLSGRPKPKPDVAKAANNKLPPVLTIDDVKDYLRISKNQAYELIGNGKLSSFRVGKGIRVQRDVLLSWVKSGGV